MVGSEQRKLIKTYLLKIACKLRVKPGLRRDPADLLTCDTSIEALQGNAVWKSGPTFMQEMKEAWPTHLILSPLTVIRLPVKAVTGAHRPDLAVVKGEDQEESIELTQTMRAQKLNFYSQGAAGEPLSKIVETTLSFICR